jgi:hypothetical protein
MGFCRACTLPFAAVEGEELCSPCRRGALPRVAEGQPERERLFLEVVTGSCRVAQVPGTESYLREVLARLGPGTGPGHGPPGLLLLDESAPWAHALPDGSVGLTLGLLATLRDEAELAFVLAHELAHQEQKGPARRTAPRRPEPGLRGWLDRLPGGQRRDRRRLTEIFTRDFPLGYGPDAELSADARAVQILAERGYDTVAALRYLTRLEGRGPEAAGPAHLTPSAAHRRERVARTLSQIPRSSRPPVINKEVFLRAVGGFDVFARRAPGSA